MIAAVLVLILAFKAMWRVAEPNQALIISGSRDKGADGGMGFRVVTGGGTLVIPASRSSASSASTSTRPTSKCSA